MVVHHKRGISASRDMIKYAVRYCDKLNMCFECGYKPIKQVSFHLRVSFALRGIHFFIISFLLFCFLLRNHRENMLLVTAEPFL